MAILLRSGVSPAGFISGPMRKAHMRNGVSRAARGDIVGFLLTQYESNVDGSAVADTYTTLSYSPTPGRKQFAVVVQSGSANNLPTSLTGNGLTWVEKYTNNKAGSAASMGFYEATTGTPVTGSLTAVFSAGDATTGVHIHVMEFAGVDLTTPIVESNTMLVLAPSSTGQSVILPNDFEDPKNAHFYMITRPTNEATGSDDFIELSDQAHNGPNRSLSTGYKVNDNIAQLTWPTAGAARWIAVELKSS